MKELQSRRYTEQEWNQDILACEQTQQTGKRFLENNHWSDLYFATTYPKDHDFRRERFVKAMTWLQEHAGDVNGIYGINDEVMRLNEAAKHALYLAFVVAEERGLPEVSDSDVLSAIRKLHNRPTD